LVEILIKHLMGKEGGTKMGYSLEVHPSDEASRTFLKILIVVVQNLCSKCFENNN
jgi:hypothetical protein